MLLARVESASNQLARARSSFIDAALAEAAARTRTSESRRKYVSDLRGWLEFCDERRVDPARPTNFAATAYREVLSRTAAPATTARKLAVLSSLYRRLTAQGFAASDPFDADALARPNAAARRPHPAVEQRAAERILATCARDTTWHGQRDLALLSLLYWTGQRCSEVARLVTTDLREDGADLFARLVRKGGRPGEILLPAPAAQALRAWLSRASTGPIFPTTLGGTRALCDRDVRRIVATRAREAKAPGVTSHQFRARVITDLLGVVPLQVAQAYVGHSDPRTTLRYDREATRGDAAARALSKLRRPK